MMSAFSKMVLIPIMYFTPIMTMSLSSYFSMWMMLELSTMTFITILALSRSENSTSMWEASIMYFLIQTLTSAMLMVLFIMLYSSNYINNMQMLINMVLFTKIGIPPFHSWIPWIMMKMSWYMCFMLTTLQKIIPLMILEEFHLPKFTFFMALMTVSISSILIMKNTLMKKIMAYSSISHSAWMIVINMINMNLMIIYFLFYMLITRSMFDMLMKMNIFTISDLNKLSSSMKWIQKIFMLITVMSFGGLPPFSGFLIKFYAIMSIQTQSLLITWMILTSLINLFVYLRMWANTLFIFQSNITMNYYMNNNYKFKFDMKFTMMALFTFWLASYLMH